MPFNEVIWHVIISLSLEFSKAKKELTTSQVAKYSDDVAYQFINKLSVPNKVDMAMLGTLSLTRVTIAVFLLV